jgi:hypothetical protein
MEQELKQEGAVEEQVTETPSEPVSKATPPEEKATSERIRGEEEFRKIQSMKDKAEAALQSAQKELQELRKFNEQQRLETRKKELDALADDPDGLAKVRHRHQLEDEITRLEQKRLEEEGAVARKYDQAANLAKEYNLNLDEARELLDATSPKEMELMAKLKAVEKAKVPIPKEEKTGFPKPDSGTSDAGADSDEAFLKRWNAGIEPVTKESMARAQKIINK